MANNPYVNKVVYAGNTLMDVSEDTVDEEYLLNGYTAHKKDGSQITGTFVPEGGSAVVVTEEQDSHGGVIKHITAVDLSDDTVTANNLQYGYTAHDRQGHAITGTLVPSGGGNLQNNKDATPSTSTQTITPDTGYDGLRQVTVNPIPQQYIVPTGTKSITANGTGIDVAAFSLADVSVPTLLQSIVMRPDATLVQKWTLDKSVVNDDKATIPAYNTSAQVVIAAAALTPTITLDYANYLYYVVERFLTIPSYNTTTKEKGRPDYCCTSYLYEINEIEANTFQSIDGTIYGSRTTNVSGMTWTRAPYWSSPSALGMYTATTYTTGQVATTPSISSGVMTITAPSVQMRGSTTYFTSSAWGKITDIRRQYVIEVWKCPKDSLNIRGWGNCQQMIQIANCIDGTTNKLV